MYFLKECEKWVYIYSENVFLGTWPRDSPPIILYTGIEKNDRNEVKPPPPPSPPFLFSNPNGRSYQDPHSPPALHTSCFPQDSAAQSISHQYKY